MRAWLAALLLACLATPASGWSMHQGDARNSGRSPAEPLLLPQAVVWEVRLPAPLETGPLLAADTVYVADSAGTVHALWRANGTLRWTRDIGDRVAGAPAIAQGTVFAATLGGDLVALDAKSGREVARAKSGPTRAPVTVHDGKVFLGNEAGEMRAYTTALDPLWTFKTAGVREAFSVSNTTGISCSGPAHSARPVRTGAAVHDGAVVFGTLGHRVYALDEHGRPDGGTALLWTHAAGDIVQASPVVDAASGRVFVASFDRSVAALPVRPAGAGTNPCLGAPAVPLWRLAQEGAQPVHATPALLDGVLLLATNGGRVQAVRTADGSVAWTRELASPVLGGLVTGSGGVIVGTEDGFVRILSARDGQVQWERRMADAVRASVAPGGADLFVATAAGTVARFGQASAVPKPAVPTAAPPPAAAPPDAAADLAVALQADGEEAVVLVTNAGPAASLPTQVRLRIGSDSVRLDVPGLEPGASVTVRHAHGLPPGEHAMRAALDSEDRDAGNDVAEAMAVVPQPGAAGAAWWQGPLAWGGAAASALALSAAAAAVLVRRRRARAQASADPDADADADADGDEGRSPSRL